MNKLIDKILTEWSYRVYDGMPNIKNPVHLIQLRESLEHLKIDEEVIDIMMNKLYETDVVKNKKSGNQYVVKTHNPDTQDLVVKDASKDDIEKVKKGEDIPTDDKETTPVSDDEPWVINDDDTPDEIAEKVSSKGAPKVVPTKGPEDVNRRTEEERAKIFRGEKTGKGIGPTAAQEECANIGREIASRDDFKEPPPLAEQIYKEITERYPEAVGKKPAPFRRYKGKNSLWKACQVSDAGAKTMKNLKSDKKVDYAEKQPKGHPAHTTDGLIARDTLITELKNCKGDKECEEHYHKEIKKFQKHATDKSVTGKEGDADTMVIYTDSKGRTKVHYVTNKQTVGDQMSSGTLNSTRRTVLENADKYFPKDKAKEGGQKVTTITEEQFAKSNQFNENYVKGTKQAAKENKEDLSEPKVSKALGIAMSVDHGQQGKSTYSDPTKQNKNRMAKYTTEAQKSPEVQARLMGMEGAPSNDIESDEYKKWKSKVNGAWKNKEREYGPEETSQAILDVTGTGALTGVGSGAKSPPYAIIKAVNVTRTIRENMDRCMGGNESKIKECAEKVSKQPESSDKNKIMYGGNFSAEDVEAIYRSKGLKALEDAERKRGQDISGMYNDTTRRLQELDAEYADENNIKDIPPKNGPHTKAYVKSFLDRTHLSDYMSGKVDGEKTAEYGSVSASPENIRKCIGKLTDFDGDSNDVKALEEHVMNNVIPAEDEQTLIYINKNNERVIIGRDTHRTAGKDSKVSGQFGSSLQKCIKEESER